MTAVFKDSWSVACPKIAQGQAFSQNLGKHNGRKVITKRYHSVDSAVRRERIDMAIDIRGIAPLLQVFDMPTSIKFYCEVLGFEIVTTDGKTTPHFDWVLLRLNGVELMLNTAYESHQRPSHTEPARIAAHKDIGLFFGCPDVDAAYRHLSAMGVKAPEPRVAPYGMKQLHVADPDGYELCFQWRA